MQEAIENATDLFTGAKGGNVKVTIKNGKPTEILIMDTDDVNTCKRVWRWNIAGFGYSDNGINGPYTTAITMDGPDRGGLHHRRHHERQHHPGRCAAKPERDAPF